MFLGSISDCSQILEFEARQACKNTFQGSRTPKVKESKDYVLNPLVYWFFASKLKHELICLNSPPILNLKCQKFMQEIIGELWTESHKIQQTGHLLPYWLVPWKFVVCMFLPVADSMQSEKLSEGGRHRDWYREPPISWLIIFKNPKVFEIRSTPSF